MAGVHPDRFGPYRIAGVIGRGAMGVVYRAIDERDGRPAAVKTVAEELLVGEEAGEMLERFRREAEIGRRLSHPGIVRVFDHGEEAGLLYLAMELVEGRELKALAEMTAVPPPTEVIGYGVQLLKALDHAHAHGIVHRDVKLTNILIRPDQHVKLMDFGIAHLADSDLTRAGDLLGSPSFMAPEQVRGDPVDARTDLFAAGIVLYVLLAGRRPFLGNVAAVMHQILTLDPPRPSEANPACPPSFDPVLVRALAKQPSDRWADATTFARALEDAQSETVGDDFDSDTTVILAAPPIVGEAAGRPVEPTGSEALGHRLAALLTDCLDDAVTERRLAEAIAMTDRLAEHTVGSKGLQKLVEPVLPRLAERILAGYPAPADDRPPPRPDWSATVRLFARLRRHDLRQGGALQSRISGELVAACFGYSARLNRLLFTEAEPDVARISLDLLRLDVLQLGLEDLGAEAEARRARQALRGFAGQVIAKANALIGSFLGSGDALARFSVANLLVSVEDLIGIADRLFDYGDDEPVGAAEAVGQAVIAEFADKAARLVELVVGEALDELARPVGDTAAFAHRLDQAGFVYLFATRLRDPRCRVAMIELVRRAQAALRRLGEAASEALTGAFGDTPEALLTDDSPASTQVRTAFGRISALIALAERLGWAELRKRLMSDLRSSLTSDPSVARLAAPPT